MRTTICCLAGSALAGLLTFGCAAPISAQTMATQPSVPRATTTTPPRATTVPSARRIEPPRPAPSIDTNPNPNAGRGQSL